MIDHPSEYPSEYPIDFCVQLARATAQGKKTLTYQPIVDQAMTSAELLSARSFGSVGDVLWVRESWGTARGKTIYVADCVGDAFSSKPKFPVGFLFGKGPLPRDHARLLLDVVAIDLAQLQTQTEATARQTVTAPKRAGRVTWGHQTAPVQAWKPG